MTRGCVVLVHDLVRREPQSGRRFFRGYLVLEMVDHRSDELRGVDVASVAAQEHRHTTGGLFEEDPLACDDLTELVEPGQRDRRPDVGVAGEGNLRQAA